MFKNQKGFTLIELLTVIWCLIVFGAIGGLIYVAWHFIAKFW